MFDYTAEQQQAVFNLDDNIILGAGAGSGKTRVLVGRYLHILETRRASINQILAITFTNRAANEMLERIREELLKRSQTGDLPEKEHWYNNLLKLNQARISTFHSFAARILRENPVLAGLDPDFRVLDEEKATRLLDEIIEEIIEEGLASKDGDLLYLAREFNIYSLPGILTHLFKTLQKTSLTAGDIIERTTSYHQLLKEEFESFKWELIQTTEELLETYENEDITPKSRERLDELKDNWPVIREALQKINHLGERSFLVSIEKMSAILKQRFSKAVSEQVKTIKEMLNGDRLLSYLVLEMEEGLLEPVGKVTGKIEEKYFQRKRGMFALDFSDLELILLKLLTENQSLLNSLQNSFSYIMGDEFQDNSPRQEKLISLLAEGEGVNLFLVGDPKQSIYRFRGADVTVFKRQREKILAQNGQEFKLTRNFRSRQGILNFSNYLFSRLMDTQLDERFIDYQPLEFHRPGGNDCIEVRLVDQTSLADNESRREEAYLLANRIRDLVNNQEVMIEAPEGQRVYQYGDIAILFQSLTNVVEYEEALQAYGIPYVVVNGRGFYDQQEVVDIINLLKVIDNHLRNIPLAGLLRSPFCGISDEDLYRLCQGRNLWSNIEKVEKMTDLNEEARGQIIKLRTLIQRGRDLKESLSTVELICLLLEEGNYTANLAANPYYQQKQANISKLLRIIDEYDRVELPSVRDLIDYLEEKRQDFNREGMALVEQEGSNLVQLMSIHQAKGLEFPVVLLPDCQRRIFNHNYVPPVLLDEVKGLAIKVKYPYQDRSYQPSPLYRELFEREKGEEISESQRLFYVAVTRARDYLILSGSIKGKLSCDDFGAASSWLDWLAWTFEGDLVERARNGEKFTFSYGEEEGEVILKVCGEQEKIVPVLNNYRAISNINPADEGIKLPELSDWNNPEAWYQVAPLARPLPWYPGRQRPVYSVTGLMVYQDCPRQFYLKYIRGLPDYQGLKREIGLEYTGNDKSRTLSPLEKGTLVHRLWELSNYGTGFEEAYLQALHELEIIQQPDEETKAGIRQLYNSYREKQKKRKAEYPDILEEKWEQEFFLLFPSFYLGGQIDYLIKFRDGSAEINDLKTNNITPEELQGEAEYYRLQMEAYALAVYKVWGLAPVKARLDFLLPELEWSFTFNKEDFPVLEEKIKGLGEGLLRLHNAEDFQKGSPEGCRYCNYSHLCQRVFT